MKHVIVNAVIVAAMGATISVADAAPCQTASGPALARVVELYTSEGCSSCPPADAWLTRLPASRELVPLGFHVHYWDYIGWKDIYAKPEYTARQKRASARAKVGYVYTPQVLSNGEDTRTWRGLQPQAGGTALAQVNLHSDVVGGQVIVQGRVAVADADARKDAAAYIALTQNNITSQVKAGENKGETLKHHHVVRAFLGPFGIDAQGQAVLRESIPVPSNTKATDLSVAVLVENSKTGKVLQALRSAAVCE